MVTITHLPQIASLADRHFRVEKVPGDPTHTRIEQLDDDERREELERMLGGEEFLAAVQQDAMSFVEFTARPARPAHEEPRPRLGPDDIAIIDHTDLDRVSAEELLESGVRVVVNVAPSQTGRFPNPGPLLLVRGGVRLIDAPGADSSTTSPTASDSPSAAPASSATARCLATGRELGGRGARARRSPSSERA